MSHRRLGIPLPCRTPRSGKWEVTRRPLRLQETGLRTQHPTPQSSSPQSHSSSVSLSEVGGGDVSGSSFPVSTGREQDGTGRVSAEPRISARPRDPPRAPSRACSRPVPPQRRSRGPSATGCPQQGVQRQQHPQSWPRGTGGHKLLWDAQATHSRGPSCAHQVTRAFWECRQDAPVGVEQSRETAPGKGGPSPWGVPPPLSMHPVRHILWGWRSPLQGDPQHLISLELAVGSSPVPALREQNRGKPQGTPLHRPHHVPAVLWTLPPPWLWHR